MSSLFSADLDLQAADVSLTHHRVLQVRKLLNGQTLYGLVNNAGVAYYGPLMHQPIEEFRKNVEINLVGTLQVTQVRYS